MMGAQRGMPEEDAEDEVKNELIRAALNKPVSMAFPNPTPIGEVLKYIKSATTSPKLPEGIPIYVDPTPDPNNPGGEVDPDSSPVRISLEGVRLKTSLRLALRQLELVYVVKEGLLIITHPNSEELRTSGTESGGMGAMVGGPNAGGLM
jgi:hypothetical protein